MSYSNKQIGPISTQAWTTRSFIKAVTRAGLAFGLRPDVVYSHFLFPAGSAGAAVAKRLGCPSVVALGESSFEHAERMRGRDHVSEILQSFDGILSVSQENADIASERYHADRSLINVVPNAVDTERFRPHDRREARQTLGLPENATILSFTGHFIERKGPLRVAEAMQQVEGLYGVFLGEGPQKPSGDRVLHAGRVPHDQVALWLSASDFFALPTLAEGSPNAVIEAMACGLPVVSSDIPALRETVSADSALLVDPRDIGSIAGAFAKLTRDTTLRDTMSTAALERGRRTSLAARAQHIRAWLRDIAGRN
jgi:glycosyltransferase involved in cell wall biosynthesis